MSAYLVNPEHIGALARYAFDNECCKYGVLYSDPLTTSADISDCLAKANIDSINCRYNCNKPDKGNKLFILSCRDYTKTVHKLTPYDIGQMVNCLDYQSCEPDDWYESKAFKVLQSIRESVLRDILKGQNAIRDYSIGAVA